MVELTFTAVVDESRIIRLPDEIPLGEIVFVAHEPPRRGSMAAIMAALDRVPQTSDPTIWERAREELLRSREEE